MHSSYFVPSRAQTSKARRKSNHLIWDFQSSANPPQLLVLSTPLFPRPPDDAFNWSPKAILSEPEDEGLPCHRAVDVSPGRFWTGAA